MSKKVVTFGEIMMRLCPPGHQRFVQARAFDVTYGGGEANVAVSLANYGQDVDYITRLPNNELGEACLQYLRQYGVGTSKIVRGGDRLGIYFLETGAAQRGSKVVYDRANSALATIKPGMIDWQAALADADWFHWTGITPAISEGAAQVCLEAARTAREMGLTVSCDLNYRANLWKWGRKASEVMPELVAQCHVAVGNEEDADKVFGIRAEGSDVTQGRLVEASYRQVAKQLHERFGFKYVAITLRESLSASANGWAGMLYDGCEHYVSRRYEINPIVDRVGGGDSFSGGLIYGLLSGLPPQQCIEFAVAASCLKHSIPGDFNLVTIKEVETLLGGDASGRVQR